jgi:hypothetical protein
MVRECCIVRVKSSCSFILSSFSNKLVSFHFTSQDVLATIYDCFFPLGILVYILWRERTMKWREAGLSYEVTRSGPVVWSDEKRARSVKWREAGPSCEVTSSGPVVWSDEKRARRVKWREARPSCEVTRSGPVVRSDEKQARRMKWREEGPATEVWRESP